MNLLLSVLILLLQTAKTACFAGDGVKTPDDYNVVMILMETLRRDHLSCYGYPRKTSPNIDKLSAESVVFENAFAQSSQSLISAASIFTGLYPPTHGVISGRNRLDPDIATLAGELKKRGYKTAAFTAGFFLNHSFGLNSGFEVYKDTRDFGTFHDILPDAMRWMRENKAKKFFLLVHSYDCHAPYRAPKEFLDRFNKGYDGILSKVVLDYNLADRVYEDGLYEDFRLKKKVAGLGKRDIDYIVSQYDGAVLYADSYVGRLLSEVEAQGLKDKTLVLFMASAGEALMDHGTIISSFHGMLYDEGIHVPLMFRVPGVGAFRAKTEAQLVDVMPTVLDILRVDIPKGAQGITLKPVLKQTGESIPVRTVYSETPSLATSLPCIGIRKYPWKLISADGRYELFNLADDPKEKKNLAEEKPEVLEARTADLNLFLASIPRRKVRSDKRPTAIVRERMKAMGYWWMDRPRVKSWKKYQHEKSGR
ncbi:MAG: sulfatase [bacterium]